MDYRVASKLKGAPARLAKEKAFKTFQELQIRFKVELDIVNAGANSRRGTPLSNSVRATNIAKTSRRVAKLELTSHTQAQNLVKFTQQTIPFYA